jgi:CDP-glycerol glycerophosphotransferase
MTRLSVVVPFYGVETYIHDCLDSIRSQSLNDIEVILVDDGSLDGSRAIAERFCDNDARFTMVTQSNAGLGPARNTGAAHASGEYLTFIDSDDLVTIHGLERMVDGLDRSGSSFAGGNAMRFNNTSGSHQSWTHRHAFAQSRRATHITEHPTLARDRMIWNKVYRRSFWDEFGYAFPAIRYEDYPVTLKAHLDALTVDVHSAPVYFWRERESGDSITQQRFRYDNLLDRVVSAEMVLQLSAGTSARVRSEVVDALAESDLVTLTQAFANVPDEEVDRLLALALRLAGQLGEESVRSRHPFDRIQFHALMAQDVPLLRRLAVFRDAGGLRGALRGTRHPRMPWRVELPYPGLGSSSVPRRLFAVPRRQVGLRTSVTDSTWTDAGLRVRGTAEIRHVRTVPGSVLKVRFGQGHGATALTPTRFETRDSHGDVSDVGFEVLVTPEMLRRAADGGRDIDQFHVSLRTGSHFSADVLKGPLRGSASSPVGGWVDEHTWAQPTSTRANAFVVSWLRDPARLTAARLVDGDFVLTVEVPGRPDAPLLVFDANRLAPELACVPTDAKRISVGSSGDEVTALEFRIPQVDLVKDVEYDDPFRQSNVRGVRLRTADDEEATPLLIVWATAPETVAALESKHLIRLTRSRGARLNAIEGPPRVTAHSARLTGSGSEQCFEVSGHSWLDDRDIKLQWRRFLPNSDIHVDVPCTLDWVGSTGEWRASAPLSCLLDVPKAPDLNPDPTATLADWSLFVATPEHAESVLMDAFLECELPIRAKLDARQAILRPRADILHIEIRGDA